MLYYIHQSSNAEEDNMVTKYIFGTPYDTLSVVEEVPLGENLTQLACAKTDKLLCFTRPLKDREIVYGLGENVRGINKRGGRYISYNVDNPHHDPQKTVSLYGAHNFLVIDGENSLGFFFDTPGRVIFDVDYEGSGLLDVRCDGGNLNLYCIAGSSAYDVTRQFLRIIGPSFLPPLWAFGFMQSRWGYKTEKDIRKVVSGYQKAGIPLDSVCMDIDYMDRYIDFTVNKRRFPDLPGFAAELKAQGIRLVPIIDAGIKVEPGNKTYEEGVKNGYFCKGKQGEDFQAAVWPGMTHFTDFWQADARKWFGQKYKFLTDQGIDGFWNDMNEPSIFYSQYNSSRFKGRDKLEGEDDLYQSGCGICDYKNFYHQIDGKQVLHHDVHNAYGYLMTKSAGTELKKMLDHRYLLFSRSSYIGAHRYGGIWTGDNSSSWEHLGMVVRQMPGLNMCGFLYSGCDIGGFGGNTSRELLLRWLAFGVFTPLMRNHSSLGTRNQECYRFRGKEDFRSIVSLRYRLLPYIYSEFMKAALRQDLYIKPLGFAYPGDETARRVEDQLLVGDSIMVTPLLEKGKTEREVYLPEDMTQVFYDGSGFTFTSVSQGHHTIHAELNQVVFFIRKGKLLPIGEAVSNTSQLNLTAVKLYGDGKQYELYCDDGASKDCSLANIKILTK